MAEKSTLDSDGLQVVQASDRNSIKTFIKIPWSIHSQDPNWVPPLHLERAQHLSKSNPYFAHAQCCLWIAYRGERPVGRISAQIDQFHEARYHDQTGFFGMLESENDEEVFKALLSTAEQWLWEQGIRRMSGPFNLSINQECGLLVDGFHAPPMIMMGHAQPYYQQKIEQQGYRKAKDLLAYKIGLDFTIPPIVQKAIKKAQSSVTFRSLRRPDFKNELQTIQDIFEDAWADNWGFIPFSKEEFSQMGQELRLFVHDSFVQIAEVDGKPAAMLVAFPNINEIIQDLNGLLFPLGWLKFLWRLKVRLPQTARVALMGVRKQYQGSPLGAILAFGMIDAVRTAGRQRGIQEVELSWILEDNEGMKNMLHAIKGIPYKTYRIYEKHLTGSA